MCARRGRELDQPLARACAPRGSARAGTAPAPAGSAPPRCSASSSISSSSVIGRARRIHGAVAEDLGQPVARRRLRPAGSLARPMNASSTTAAASKRRSRSCSDTSASTTAYSSGASLQRLEVDLLGPLDLVLALAQRSLRHQHARQRAACVALAIELLELAEGARRSRRPRAPCGTAPTSSSSASPFSGRISSATTSDSRPPRVDRRSARRRRARLR